MPGPIIYVAAAVAVVGTVAAVIAFREYVYEPRIAPKVEGWTKALEENRKRKRAMKQRTLASPVKAQSGPADLARSSSDSKKSDDLDNDGISVELQDLVAKEAAEWRVGPNGTLRLRKPKSNTVLDESNVFLPFDPISPTQLASPSSPSSPLPGPSGTVRSPPIIHSPLPRAPATFNVSLPLEPSSPSPAQRSQRDHEILFDAADVSHPLSVSSSRTASTSPSETELANSTSTTSSFTPAVIGPRSVSSYSRYGTPHSSSISAFDDVVSLPSSASGSRITSPFVDINQAPVDATELGAAERARSEVGSPFTDVHAVSPRMYTLRSPSPVVVSPGAQSSLHLGAESDIAVLSPSLRSGMFSPGFSSVDDAFDVASVDGSDLSSWASVGRRTPEP